MMNQIRLISCSLLNVDIYRDWVTGNGSEGAGKRRRIIISSVSTLVFWSYSVVSSRTAA